MRYIQAIFPKYLSTNLVKLVNRRGDGSNFISWNSTNFKDTVEDLSVIDLA